MRWRIYYDDGSVFTDQDGSPWDAPRTGVQAIAQPNDRIGWYILHSADAYYFEASREGWSKADEYTKWDHLIRAYYPLLIFGRQMSDAAYQEILKRVHSDLPTPKTGRLRGER